MAGMKRRLLTPEFRMSFAKLITPEAYKENGKDKGEPKYSVECIFSPESLTKFLEDDGKGGFAEVDVRLVCAQVAKAEWPDMNPKEAVETKTLFWPIYDGDQYVVKQTAKATAKGKAAPDLKHYAGKKLFRISAAKEYPPVLSFKDKGATVSLNRASDSDLAKAKQVFTGGNYAIAEITVKATATAQGKFVNFYVNSVRMTRTGDALGGGGGMMNRFDGVQGGKSDKDPTVGIEDEIPF